MTTKLITVKDLKNTMAIDKAMPYMSLDCKKTCQLCGYHTHDKNASGQYVHNYCMNDYSNFVKQLVKEKSCSICGSKTKKLILDSNCCNSCLNSAFD
jgi:hypothetical protein